MKKLTTLLIICCMALMLTFGLTACGDKTCEHIYDNAKKQEPSLTIGTQPIAILQRLVRFVVQPRARLSDIPLKPTMVTAPQISSAQPAAPY